MMTELIRKVVLALVIIGLSVGAFKFIMLFKPEPQINELVESVKLVKTRQVVLDTNDISIPVYGHLEALNEIDIFPEMGGVLRSKGFREGNAYSEGDVIAFIDNVDMASNIKSQKSGLLNLVAKLVADMKFDFPDNVQVWDQFLDKIDFDKDLPELPVVTDPQLKRYLAGKNIYTTYFNIRSQEQRAAKYIITAPFDGVLTEAMIKPGTVVRMGQKIGKFINTTEFELLANVSLHEGAQLSIGNKVLFKSNDVQGVWTGTISRINKSLSKNSQNMNVFINVNDPTLFNGMYLFGDVHVDHAINTIALDRSLVTDGKAFKIIDNKLIAVEVKIVQTNESSVVVSGLTNNDLILEEVVKGAYDGMKIRY